MIVEFYDLKIKTSDSFDLSKLDAFNVMLEMLEFRIEAEAEENTVGHKNICSINFYPMRYKTSNVQRIEIYFKYKEEDGVIDGYGWLHIYVHLKRGFNVERRYDYDFEKMLETITEWVIRG